MSIHCLDVKVVSSGCLSRTRFGCLSRTRFVRLSRALSTSFSRFLFAHLLVNLMDVLSPVLFSDFSDGNSFSNPEFYRKWQVNIFVTVY